MAGCGDGGRAGVYQPLGQDPLDGAADNIELESNQDAQTASMNSPTMVSGR